VSLYGPAKTSFATLAVPVGVRAVGMGEAYTAAGADLDALHWNPAGLAGLQGFQAALAHNEWSSDLGLRQEFLAYGQSLSTASAFALSANYFDLGRLEQRDEAGGLNGESRAFAFTGTAGYGKALLSPGSLSLGAALDFSVESLFGALQSNLGVSLGALYEFQSGLRFGAALRHLGAGAGGFVPPASAELGVSSQLLQRRLTLALDLGVPLNADPALRAGAEYDFGALALRGGWRYAIGASPGDGQSGPTAGLGFKVGFFNLDYAYVPYAGLSNTHRLAATVSLPANFFAPKGFGAERSTGTAQAFYLLALAKERSGSKMESMMEYERTVDAYPEDRAKEAPQPFYLASQRRIRELMVEMSASGQSEGARQQILKNLSQGLEQYAAHRYQEAVRSAKAVLALDGANPVALKLKLESEAVLSSVKSELSADARASYTAGNLSEAVESRRAILKADPGDSQSVAFFSENRAQIDSLIKKTQRQGIDAYIAGRYDEAINLWEDGLKLDPSDALKMRRDIDKAKEHRKLESRK
jgi:hypothetical protein